MGLAPNKLFLSRQHRAGSQLLAPEQLKVVSREKLAEQQHLRSLEGLMSSWELARSSHVGLGETADGQGAGRSGALTSRLNRFLSQLPGEHVATPRLVELLPKASLLSMASFSSGIHPGKHPPPGLASTSLTSLGTKPGPG